MLFWIIAGALTLAVTLASVWPMLRRDVATAAPRTEHDMAVYRAQLHELEADQRRGTIGQAEAAVARAEVGRRLLKAAHAPASKAATTPARRLGLLAGALLVAVPAATVLAYLTFGSPQAGDMPLAAREAAPATGDVPALIAMAEQRLADNPDEGQGWDVLAPIYLRNGDATKAVNAYRRAMNLLGPSPARLSGLGEAQVMATEGRVTEGAAEAFRQALALDPQVLLPRFFLALQMMQQSRFAQAVPAWQSLLDDSPAEAPWRAFADAALVEARERAGASVAPPPPAPAMAEIAALAPPERQAAIESMVAGLAARLETAPDDIDGWTRLIRSYSILGDDARAQAAVQTASRTFPEGSAGHAAIAALVQELGLQAGDAAKEDVQ